MYTEFELKKTLINCITKAMPITECIEEYGVGKSQLFAKYRPLLLKQLGMKLGLDKPINVKTAQKMYSSGKLRIGVIESAASNVQQVKPGRPSMLMPDEETLLIAKAEMSALASAPITRKRLSNHIVSVLEQFPSKKKKTINHKSKLKHARDVIRRVNEKEPEAINQRKRTSTGEVKVSALSRRRAKQSDPRLAWNMFHAIANMYRKAKKKADCYHRKKISSYAIEVRNKLLGPEELRQIEEQPLTETPPSVESPEQPSIDAPLPSASVEQASEKVRKVITIDEASDTVKELTKVPDDLKEIQPRPNQVWNCDEIGIDPNGKFHKIVSTFKWCNADKVWKTLDGEKAPFWCTVLFFTRADGQCFIAPTVVHQATEVTEYLFLNLPDDWIVHATPNG